MSLLVIAPHMDDEVLGCGGVLQRFDKPNVLFCTLSREDRRWDQAAAEYQAYEGATRMAEMRKASTLLGYQFAGFTYETHTLDEIPTSTLLTMIENKVNVEELELVLAPGPSHDQDHEAIRKAVKALMRPHRYAGSVLEYWTWGSPSPYDPQVVVPLSLDEVDRKLRALEQYETQLAPGDDRYPYSVTSQDAFMVAIGRTLHHDDAEVFTPVRLVPNKTTARFFDA
jgi:LmbE family N-acetylglucosaminyl deacetylase